MTPVIFDKPKCLSKRYGINTTMYIFSDDSFDSYNPYNVFNPEEFQSYNEYGDEFYGLNVTDDSNLLNNPASFITAEKGEEVSVIFILGDSTGEQIEEYLLFAILGNEQAMINGQKQLPINPETNEPEAQYGELIID